MIDIKLIVSQQTMDIKMDSKYYLSIITFIIGCFFGSYFPFYGSDSGSKDVESELDSSEEITKTYLADTEKAIEVATYVCEEIIPSILDKYLCHIEGDGIKTGSREYMKRTLNLSKNK